MVAVEQHLRRGQALELRGPGVVRIIEQAAGTMLRARHAGSSVVIAASATPKLSNSPDASLPSTPGMQAHDGVQ